MSEVKDLEQELFLKEEEVAKRHFWTGTALVYIALYIPGLFFEPLTVLGAELHWYQVVVVAQIIITINSFRTQQPNEVGALLLFGQYLYQTKPGLVFAPPFVTEWRHEDSTLRQFEIPGDLPDRYGGAKTIRVTTAPSAEKEENSTDPLDTGRLTLEGSFAVASKLDTRPGAFRQFIEHVGTMENFKQMADDLVVNRFSKEVIKRTPSRVLQDWDELDRTSRELLREKVGSFGFDTKKLDVFAKGFDLPHRVNEALAERTKQHVNVETSRLEGEASKARDTLVAEGRKALKRAELDGTIEALAETKEKIGLSPDQALVLAYNEVIGKALENATYTLLPQGRGGVLDPATMMAIMQEVLKDGRNGGVT